MLLSKKKLDKIKKIKNQTQKKYKRKKKKKRRYRKRARSFRKKNKQLNLKNKSLKVKNIRKKKYKGGGMDNPVTFNLFFLTESHIKWIEVTCPEKQFRNVIQPSDDPNSLFHTDTIRNIDNLVLSKSTPGEQKNEDYKITLPNEDDPIIRLILKKNQQINLQGDNKIKITQLVYEHNKNSILNILKKENKTEDVRNQETDKAFNSIITQFPAPATDDGNDAADDDAAAADANAATAITAATAATADGGLTGKVNFRNDPKMTKYTQQIKGNNYEENKSLSGVLSAFSPDTNIPSSLGARDPAPNEGKIRKDPDKFYPDEFAFVIKTRMKNGEGRNDIDIIKSGDGKHSVGSLIREFQSMGDYESPPKPPTKEEDTEEEDATKVLSKPQVEQSESEESKPEEEPEKEPEESKSEPAPKISDKINFGLDDNEEDSGNLIYHFLNEYITQKEQEQLEEKKEEIESSLKKQSEINEKLELQKETLEKTKQLLTEKNQIVEKLREEGEKLKQEIETLNKNVPPHLREQIMSGGANPGKLTNERKQSLKTALSTDNSEERAVAAATADSDAKKTAEVHNAANASKKLDRKRRETLKRQLDQGDEGGNATPESKSVASTIGEVDANPASPDKSRPKPMARGKTKKKKAQIKGVISKQLEVQKIKGKLNNLHQNLEGINEQINKVEIDKIHKNLKKNEEKVEELNRELSNLNENIDSMTNLKLEDGIKSEVKSNQNSINTEALQKILPTPTDDIFELLNKYIRIKNICIHRARRPPMLGGPGGGILYRAKIGAETMSNVWILKLGKINNNTIRVFKSMVEHLSTVYKIIKNIEFKLQLFDIPNDSTNPLISELKKLLIYQLTIPKLNESKNIWISFLNSVYDGMTKKKGLEAINDSSIFYKLFLDKFPSGEEIWKSMAYVRIMEDFVLLPTIRIWSKNYSKGKSPDKWWMNVIYSNIETIFKGKDLEDPKEGLYAKLVVVSQMLVKFPILINDYFKHHEDGDKTNIDKKPMYFLKNTDTNFNNYKQKWREISKGLQLFNDFILGKDQIKNIKTQNNRHGLTSKRLNLDTKKENSPFKKDYIGNPSRGGSKKKTKKNKKQKRKSKGTQKNRN